MLTLKEQKLINDESKNEHISASHRCVSMATETHWHSFFEFEVIVRGEGEHVLNGESYVLRRGDAFLLNPTDFHSITPHGELELWNISFDESLISDRRLFEISGVSSPKRFVLTEEQTDKLCSIASLIKSESGERDGCTKELCECLLSVLLRLENPSLKDTGNPTGLRRALTYMKVHFRDNPTLETVARQAGFHPHYFSQIFKRKTGESFNKTLNKLKVTYAEGLLASGFSVSEACYKSGFGSLSNFLLVFKSITGITPEQYKKKAK